MNFTEAQRELMQASFELGQAQRELDDAEKRFKAALNKLSTLEGLPLTTLTAPAPIPHDGSTTSTVKDSLIVADTTQEKT